MANGWIRQTGYPAGRRRAGDASGGAARRADASGASSPIRTRGDGGRRARRRAGWCRSCCASGTPKGVKEQPVLLRDDVGDRDAGGRGRSCVVHRQRRRARLLPDQLRRRDAGAAAARGRRAAARRADRARSPTSGRWCAPTWRRSSASWIWSSSLRGEEDHVVLDEVVGRLALIEHRFLADEDRGRVRHVRHASCTARAPRSSAGRRRRGEDDETPAAAGGAAARAGRCIARDPDAVAEAGEALPPAAPARARHVDPNLLDVVVTAAARAPTTRASKTCARGQGQRPIPAAKRRYLHALARVEDARPARPRRRAGAERRRPDAGLLVVRQRAAREPRDARGGVRDDPRPLDRDARQGRLADDPAAAGRGAGRRCPNAAT